MKAARSLHRTQQEPSAPARPLRISWAFPAYFSHPVGGYNVHYEYASRLAARGHKVTLLFPRSLQRAAHRAPGWLWALRLRWRHRPLVDTFRLHPKVRTRLVDNLAAQSLPRADVLVATAWQTAEALKGAPASRGRKHYIVYDFEHWQAAGAQERERMAATFRGGFRMLAASSAVSQMIREAGGRELELVPCGLDPRVFGADTPIETRAPAVMFAARREPTKNLDGVLAALDLVRARHGEALRIIAYGVPELKLPSFVEFHPKPSNAELRSLYNQASIFLCASFGEGWGLPSVEAMACGAALVTADNGGSRDFAYDGRTAAVTRSAQPQDLADGVCRLLADDPLRVRLAKAGLAWVGQYGWDEAAAKVEAFLQP